MQPAAGTPAYLLFGTNLGDRKKFLEMALAAIAGPEVRVEAVSSVYETEPWGTEGQPAYLNQAVAVHTTLSPARLLHHVLEVEADLGRVRRGKWGDRTIDIDILYYGSLVVESPGLEIPHPRLHLRNFVLYPLAEIAPEFIHPVLNKSNRELLAESEDTLSVCKLQ